MEFNTNRQTCSGSEPLIHFTNIKSGITEVHVISVDVYIKLIRLFIFIKVIIFVAQPDSEDCLPLLKRRKTVFCFSFLKETRRYWGFFFKGT